MTSTSAQLLFTPIHRDQFHIIHLVLEANPHWLDYHFFPRLLVLVLRHPKHTSAHSVALFSVGIITFVYHCILF